MADDDEEIGGAKVDPYSVLAKNLGGSEGAILQLMQQRQSGVGAQQQKLMDMMQQQEGPLSQTGMSDYQKAAMMFQAAGALAAPTRSGGLAGLMEGVGGAGTALAGPLTKADEAQRARQQQLQQLQLARQKLAVEMSGNQGVSPTDMMKLVEMKRANEEETPTPSEFERVIGQLSPEERAKALRVKAGLQTAAKSEEEEYRNVVRPDGSTITILKKGDQTLDPMTRQPLDLGKIVEEQRASVDADRQSQALEYGVPLITTDPYAALPQRDREKARLGRYQADTRVLQKQAEDLPDSVIRNEIMDYKRFSALNNENQRTGPGWSSTPNFSTSAQNMKEIEARLTISAGKDLKGAASDRDVAMFGQATPSLAKNPEANQNAIKFGLMKNATELERRAFLRDYLAVNKTLEGADRKWDDYRNANPFFNYPPNADISKLDPAKLEENKNRLSYGDYFRQQSARGATPVTRNEQGQLVIGGQ